MLKNKEFQDKVLSMNTFLNSKQVAEILNISTSKTSRFMQSGEIPTVRIGKFRRVRPEDLIQ